MDSRPLPQIIARFANLPDPRIDRTNQHELLDIVTIALLAVVSEADSWVEVAAYGRSTEGWLRTFLALPNGIPSHDSFGRLFALLDPEQFAQRFLAWVRQVIAPVVEPVIAVDGKTVRRSHDRGRGKGPLQLINAWATGAWPIMPMRSWPSRRCWRRWSYRERWSPSMPSAASGR